MAEHVWWWVDWKWECQRCGRVEYLPQEDPPEPTIRPECSG